MSYSLDLVDSAHRHLQAADCLYAAEPSCRRIDIAGYLYGLAAECALKEMMRRAYSWSKGRDRALDEMFYAHFPALKVLLRDWLSGRRPGGELWRYANDSGLLNEWDVAMRYAPRAEISVRSVARWRDQARALVQEMQEQS